MLYGLRCLSGTLLLGAVSVGVQAQVTTAPGESTPRESKTVGTVPRVPGVTTLFSGFNAGVSYSAVHNSAIGWYTVATPALSYTFSDRYSADVSTSLYFHRLVESTKPGAQPVQRLVVQNVNAGDTVIGAHATFFPGELYDVVSAYLTAPTGDHSAGLGTGRVTFDVSNHAERYYKKVGFLLDVGVGDSSGLVNSLVARNYNSLGALAHFQSGAVIWLPGRTYFEASAYEQLPIGSQTVYNFFGEPGERTRSVISTSSVPEDNGFITYAGLPLTDHLTLSGYYYRSLRRKSDTVSFGITYVMRGSWGRGKASMIDKALEEAERPNQ